MNKTISIHQPNFLPWLGFFYKIVCSDVFVILDDVQYTKNSIINRNKIKTSQGSNWITLPVSTSGKFGQLINECRIQDKEKHALKILKTIENNYSNASYFNIYIEKVKDLLLTSDELLINNNMAFIKFILDILNIKTQIVFSSQLKNIKGENTERLVSICNELNATEYIHGFDAVRYQKNELFVQNNIKLSLTTFKHPVYTQLWGGFLPCMSVIDILFNCGISAKEIIKSSF